MQNLSQPYRERAVCKRDVLHVEGSSYGTKVNIPQIESVLALEGVPWDGTLVCQHQKNVIKVKCGHLKEK